MAKRTLQEIANFFDMAVTIDWNGDVYLHKAVPYLQGDGWLNDEGAIIFSYRLVDFSGDWRESLTLPDSWPKESPFKFGELVISKGDNKIFAQWGKHAANKNTWRRPTKAEWKVLKGEE